MSRSLIQILAIFIAIAVILVIAVPGFLPIGVDEAESQVDATADQSESDASTAVAAAGPRADVQPTSRPAGSAIGNRAPDFELLDPDGNTHRLSDYLGQVVVLDFWGTWCGPCIRIMPQLQAVHEKYDGRGVHVIGISCRERPGADPGAFMAQRGFTYRTLLNGEVRTAQDYGIQGYPTLLVIGVDGEIIHREMGAAGDKEAKLSTIIDEHLAAHGLM